MTFRTLPSRQGGSTLTGIIIGLIIGLGIAVAVALTITKGASPFTDKGPKAGRPADLPAAQAQDPNKPMYANREAAREANKEVTEKAAARTSPAPAPAAAAAPAAAPGAPAGDDPLGQAIAGMKEPAPRPQGRDSHPMAATVASAAPAAPAPAAAPAAGSPDRAGDTIYYLQAGSFRDLSDAESTRAKLALLGFEAAISDHSSDSGVLHRVRLGPYKQVETMNKARAKLLDSGVDVAIVRSQR
jgi:cell division protein FtsN